MENYFDVP